MCAGATTTPQELVAYAAEAVSEPAAAPREVVVLDVLPVTAIGKPYKVGLRRHAVERAARDALRDAGVDAMVEGVLVDGELTICVRTSASRSAVAAVLNRFAIPWQVA